MGIAFQKITVSLLLICGAISYTVYAQEPSKCSSGTLMVGQTKVGTTTYFAQNCRKAWQRQSIKMEFNYSQNIPEWAFKRAARHYLNKNIGTLSDELAFEQITSSYQAVKNGDLYVLDYDQQGQWLSLYLNGRLLRKVQHPKIDQYFSIWLGPTPFSVKLKQQLLN